jgi:hypothetical protein
MLFFDDPASVGCRDRGPRLDLLNVSGPSGRGTEMFRKGDTMVYFDRTIELPVDAAEAVKLLRRELRAAESRLAEARHQAVLANYWGARRVTQNDVSD